MASYNETTFSSELNSEESSPITLEQVHAYVVRIDKKLDIVHSAIKDLHNSFFVQMQTRSINSNNITPGVSAIPAAIAAAQKVVIDCGADVFDVVNTPIMTPLKPPTPVPVLNAPVKAAVPGATVGSFDPYLSACKLNSRSELCGAIVSLIESSKAFNINKSTIGPALLNTVLTAFTEAVAATIGKSITISTVTGTAISKALNGVPVDRRPEIVQAWVEKIEELGKIEGLTEDTAKKFLNNIVKSHTK